MRMYLVIALAAASVFGGFGGRIEAGEPGPYGARAYALQGSRGDRIAVGVPLLFYTSKKYSSSMYGSPGNPNCFFGSRSTSRKYYRYQANPWYTNKVYTRY